VRDQIHSIDLPVATAVMLQRFGGDAKNAVFIGDSVD
jgi:hypothetical protein